MQALCGAELRWSPPNWELRNLGGRACFHLQQPPLVLLLGRMPAPQARCKRETPQPAVLDWRPSRSSQWPPCRHLVGGVAYRRLFAGVLLCCAKDLLFHAKGTTYWRRPAGLSDCRSCAIRTFVMRTRCPALWAASRGLPANTQRSAGSTSKRCCESRA